MGQITVTWGKFKVELPGELFLLLAARTFHVLYSMST